MYFVARGVGDSQSFSKWQITGHARISSSGSSESLFVLVAPRNDLNFHKAVAGCNHSVSSLMTFNRAAIESTVISPPELSGNASPAV